MSIFQAIPDEEGKIDQGDVFVDIYFAATDERVNAVVVSPACDLEHNKADFIKFVSTVSFELVAKDILLDHSRIDDSDFGSGVAISRTKYNSAMNVLTRNINGDLLPRYYFLPGYSDSFPDSYLDFQKVFVIQVQQVFDSYMTNRITRIASPWREQIAERYSGYSGRVGTPDYSEGDLRSLLSKVGLNLPPYTPPA